jgi:hypothetical protein
MNRFWALILLLSVTPLTLACGSSNRHLQSITIKAVPNGQQIQFVATGTFSASPTTVSPLPVSWSVGLFAPPPHTLQYTLTTQPFTFQCNGAAPFGGPVVALAPADPNAPSSGSMSFRKMVVASGPIACP